MTTGGWAGRAGEPSSVVFFFSPAEFLLTIYRRSIPSETDSSDKPHIKIFPRHYISLLSTLFFIFMHYVHTHVHYYKICEATNVA